MNSNDRLLAMGQGKTRSVTSHKLTILESLNLSEKGLTLRRDSNLGLHEVPMVILFFIFICMIPVPCCPDCGHHMKRGPYLQGYEHM